MKILLLWLSIAVLADAIAADSHALIHWAPATVDKSVMPFSPPSSEHWLGTDASRRDVLSRLVHGTRVTLGVGFAAALLMLTIGTTLGLIACYSGRWLDAIISRLCDAVLAVPIFFVALAVLGTIPRAGAGVVIVTLGLCAWPSIARVVRLETRSLKDAEFVIAARMMGGSHWYVVRHHIVPHLTGLLMVAFVLALASAALVEASLSFLGFGVPDEVASWGGLMRGSTQMLSAWWLIVPPGLALTSVVVACMTIADGSQSPRPRQLLSDRPSA